MGNPILLSIIAALGWAGAPLLSRIAGISPVMMGTLVCLGTGIVALPMMAGGQDVSSISTGGLLKGLLAGLLNGIGVYAFYALVGGGFEGKWDLSQYLPIAFVLTPIIIAAGLWVFFGETLTMNKLFGLALTALAIWFLNK